MSEFLVVDHLFLGFKWSTPFRLLFLRHFLLVVEVVPPAIGISLVILFFEIFGCFPTFSEDFFGVVGGFARVAS